MSISVMKGKFKTFHFVSGHFFLSKQNYNTGFHS